MSDPFDAVMPAAATAAVTDPFDAVMPAADPFSAVMPAAGGVAGEVRGRQKTEDGGQPEGGGTAGRPVEGATPGTAVSIPAEGGTPQGAAAPGVTIMGQPIMGGTQEPHQMTTGEHVRELMKPIVDLPRINPDSKWAAAAASSMTWTSY